MTLPVSRWILFVTVLVALGLPRGVFAARVRLTPASVVAVVGETVTVDVRLDTEGASINAVDLMLQYPPLMTVKSVSKGGSALSLWVQEPSVSAHGIAISAGTPGGIRHENALLVRLVLQANAVGTGSIAMTSASSALLNDGQGSAATLVSAPIPITITARPPGTQPSVMPPAISTSDRRKPLSFQVYVTADGSGAQKKIFASFLTVDRDSGVDHYEIKEGSGSFRIARSPFLLSDNGLSHVIRVRAYDEAGNWREAVWPGFFKRLWWSVRGLFTSGS